MVFKKNILAIGLSPKTNALDSEWYQSWRILQRSDCSEDTASPDSTIRRHFKQLPIIFKSYGNVGETEQPVDAFGNLMFYFHFGCMWCSITFNNGSGLICNSASRMDLEKIVSNYQSLPRIIDRPVDRASEKSKTGTYLPLALYLWYNSNCRPD